jgi:3-oxoacyl-(acyl-carrier-protein) synthase
MREVWITGIGAVTAAGIGVGALQDLLLDERSGLEPSDLANGTAIGRAPTPARRSLTRRLDRSALLFFTAGEEAWRNAGLDATEWCRERTIVLEGSSIGPMGELLETMAATRRPSPAGLLRFMIGAGGATLAQAFGIQGGALHISAASVSSACAIGEGYLKVAAGLADLALVGGAECPLHPTILEGFRAAGVLAAPEAGPFPCRPFDMERSGTVLGEGAGALVLEGREHAVARRVRPLAILRGFGLWGETYGMTAPDPSGQGVRRAAEQALGDTPVEQLGWIKTHGTGTKLNDGAECRGLATLLGDALPRIPLTSLKPALGHCLGASTAVEIAAVVVALKHRLVPRTLATTLPDQDLPPCTVALRSATTSAPNVLVLAESFGGRCAALLVGAPPTNRPAIQVS